MILLEIILKLVGNVLDFLGGGWWGAIYQKQQ